MVGADGRHKMRAKEMEVQRLKIHKENVDIINKDLKMDASALDDKPIKQAACDELRDSIIICQQARPHPTGPPSPLVPPP